jgi:uncharacterized protein HemY
MRIAALAPLALLALAACASTQMTASSMPETGYTPGALGFAAIMDEDWVKAERQLAASSAERSDPARLLNLAHVYRQTGRELEARQLYRAVLDQRDRTVELANGEAASCHALARKGLDMPTGVAARR